MTGSLTMLVIVFTLAMTVSWILLWSFNPTFVHDPTDETETPGPSASRCLVGSLVAALFVVAALWMFRTCQ
jgi:uncharacterized membrane protein (DUF485 family)